ncbi:hypothetical protein ACWPM1_14760 [Tsuneonella sp. HG249]
MTVASIALATLLLAWPAVVNRGPFLIADTTGYLRSADAAISSTLSYRSIWSDKRDAYAPGARGEVPAASAALPAAAQPAHPPLIGRSIYYGALIYGPVVLFGEFAGIVLQCALCAIVVWLALVPFLGASGPRRLAGYFGTIAFLALGTSLPFTATLLVPDYLTGLATVAFVSLLLFRDAYDRWQTAILVGVILLAALSHSSNLPLLLALAAAGLFVRRMNLLRATAILAALCAVALGSAGEALFVSAVEAKTGLTPIRPPFLTARLIADGPGFAFMRTRCDSEPFEVCRYIARTPHDSDQFLWSEGDEGVFSTSSFASQTRLSHEDMKFALATFRQFPLQTLDSSARASVKQLFASDLRIWRGNSGGPPHYNLANLPAPVAKRMGDTLSYRGAMPVEPWQSISPLAALAALAAAVWCMLESRKGNNGRIRRIGLGLALVVFAIVVNAAIAGGLSKPDARYSLRVIWVLPFFAYLLAWITLQGRRR